MAHFTQLNLNSKQESKQSDATKASSQKRKMMAEEKAVLLGSLVIICLTSGAVLLTTQGCSRANEKATVANQMPQSPAVMPSAPAASAPTAPATDTKKKHKRLAIVTYKDGAWTPARLWRPGGSPGVAGGRACRGEPVSTMPRARGLDAPVDDGRS